MRKIIVVLALLLVGCSETEKYTATSHDASVAQITAILDQHDTIEHANIVTTKQAILVAIQVKPLERWRKQKVEERVKADLKKAFGQQELIVSTDFKLHWEAAKLLEEKNEEKRQKKIEKLAKLAEEEA